MPFWKLPLNIQPKVIYCGIGTHGHDVSSQRYRLSRQWGFHLYRYEGWLETDGKHHPVHDGTISLLPPETIFRHIWKRPQSIHFYSLFRFGSAPRKKLTSAPMLLHLGAEAVALFDDLSASIGGFLDEPARAEACLWHHLWKLYGTNPTTRIGSELHPAIQLCLSHMEQNSTGPMEVRNLARISGVSHNQLIRLFQAQLGLTPLAYLLKQKWKRAQTLLGSTAIPVKRIAFDLGFSDLSHFNKFVRNRCGKSPRKFRQRPTARHRGSSTQ